MSILAKQTSGKNSISVNSYDILNEMWYEIEFCISQLSIVYLFVSV